jgi:hypothetical protein
MLTHLVVVSLDKSINEIRQRVLAKERHRNTGGALIFTLNLIWSSTRKRRGSWSCRSDRRIFARSR